MEASSYQFYSVPSSNMLHVDDLLNFNNEDIFDSAKETHKSPLESSTEEQTSIGDTSSYAFNFTDDLCLPNHDASELEWVSEFMEDSFSSFSEYPLPSITEKGVFPVEESSVPAKVRSKRTKPSSLNTNWLSSPFSSNNFNESEFSLVKQQNSDRKKDACTKEQFTRKCSHCSAEKTPQWRAGPLGPKTLCNACGVRYKSGRLVPEYRPAASPSFVLTQHSNSHRKVMELRRQKEQLQIQREDMLFDYKVF